MNVCSNTSEWVLIEVHDCPKVETQMLIPGGGINRMWYICTVEPCPTAQENGALVLLWHRWTQKIYLGKAARPQRSCILFGLRRLKVKSLGHVWLFATPWTVAYQASPSMGFSRQQYWSGLPFPSPGDLPDPGVEPGSPALSADAFRGRLSLELFIFPVVCLVCPEAQPCWTAISVDSLTLGLNSFHSVALELDMDVSVPALLLISPCPSFSVNLLRHTTPSPRPYMQSINIFFKLNFTSQ